MCNTARRCGFLTTLWSCTQNEQVRADKGWSGPAYRSLARSIKVISLWACTSGTASCTVDCKPGHTYIVIGRQCRDGVQETAWQAQCLELWPSVGQVLALRQTGLLHKNAKADYDYTWPTGQGHSEGVEYGAMPL